MPLPFAGRPNRSASRGQSVVEFALLLPIMLVLLLGVVDLARIYTTMLSVESAAREAADFGTTMGAGRWQVGLPLDDTIADMQERACVASSDLPDYADPDADPATGCTNPAFSYCVTASIGGPCAFPLDGAAGCEVPTREPPCWVTVSLAYDFHLIAPMGIDFFGVRLGFPSSLSFVRDSTFAMTDIDVAP